VEQEVFAAMKKRIESLEIAKREQSKPDTEVERIKADINRTENEIRKLLVKLAEADEVLSGYIQDRVKLLHAQKSEAEERLRNKTRKRKVIDTAPLSDPMERWDCLTTQEKHDLAVAMIDVVYVSDEKGIDIRFSI
jgi:chromosome segregation ATPase